MFFQVIVLEITTVSLIEVFCFMLLLLMILLIFIAKTVVFAESCMITAEMD